MNRRHLRKLARGRRQRMRPGGTYEFGLTAAELKRSTQTAMRLAGQ